MPTYDFSCTSCKNQFEMLVPIEKRDEPVSCPKCGKSGCNRGVSAVQLSYSGFKSNLRRAGSGWNDVLKKVKKASGKGTTIKTR